MAKWGCKTLCRLERVKSVCCSCSFFSIPVLIYFELFNSEVVDAINIINFIYMLFVCLVLITLTLHVLQDNKKKLMTKNVSEIYQEHN